MSSPILVIKMEVLIWNLLFALSSAACAGSALTARQERRLADGPWGGEHLALVVTSAGAHLEFDCASGEIATPLVVDEKGHVVVDGVYVPERRGPVRAGDVPDTKAAHYDGRVNGDQLMIDVVLKESKEAVGHFTVTHGAEATLRKCR